MSREMTLHVSRWFRRVLYRRTGRAGGALALAGLVLFLPGCGELTSGGVGEIEFEIVGDSLAVAAASDPVLGTLTVGLQAFVQRGAREVELTDGIQEVTLSFAGGGEVLVAERSLPSGSYGVGRFVFHSIEGVVTGGLEVDGEPFMGAVEVTFAPENPIEIPWVAQVDVPEEGSTRLVLEMRASRWLRLLNREGGAVSREDFEANPPRARPLP